MQFNVFSNLKYVLGAKNNVSEWGGIDDVIGAGDIGDNYEERGANPRALHVEIWKDCCSDYLSQVPELGSSPSVCLLIVFHPSYSF